MLGVLTGVANRSFPHPGRDAVYAQGRGYELRHTLGTRLCFWRESLGDGVYLISGAPLRTGTGGPRYVRNAPAVTAVWKPTRHLSVLTQYVHFSPGPYFQANPPDKHVDYFTVWADYKF